MPEHIETAIFELADSIVNHGGYADTAAESDRRTDLRNALCVAFRAVAQVGFERTRAAVD